MRAYPLATVVVVTRQGLEANLLPLELCTEEGGPTRLRGHAARGTRCCSRAWTALRCWLFFRFPTPTFHRAGM
nr:FMN-binding negative transcriptional regulator [Acidovorax sp. Root267]